MPGPPLFDFGPDPDELEDLDDRLAAVGLPAGPPMLSVSELTALVREVLDGAEPREIEDDAHEPRPGEARDEAPLVEPRHASEPLTRPHAPMLVDRCLAPYR